MKKIVGAGILLLVLLLLVPLLIPTGTYLKQAEQLASQAIGQPVHIGGMQLAILPTPRVKLNDLRVGEHEEVAVGGIAVIPAISSLFSEQKIISLVDVNDLKIKREAIDFLAAMPKAAPAESSTKVVVQTIRVRNAQLVWPEMSLPALNLEAAMKDASSLASLSLDTVDGHLQAEVTPDDAGYRIALNAREWVLPAGPQLLFDTLKSEMKLQGSQLHVTSLDATLYKGKLEASGDVDWGKGLKANGKFKTDALDVAALAQLFSKEKLVSGRLQGTGTVGVQAREAAKAAEHLVLDYKFNVSQGVLHGMDLAKAATLLLNEGEKGGETRFDELSGVLHMVGKQVSLKQLKIASGLLAANGNVDISPAKALDGVVEVELKKGMALATVPLQIGGTLDKPTVFPTKAALAGAAIGTGVLGPGVGTSLGVKAASGVEKLKGLFGK